ncbi:probable carboxylesterase 12 [Mercurialis annua]|uniref:probable carboxylesterase 12 n=1 Tax=Mercurialis annua TaxID=3986 RepID=UPI002160DA95|nr:probable carboxylesterase 12 [Mercurialis annua]
MEESLSTNKADEQEEIVNNFFPFLRTYKNGRVERLMGIDIVPPSDDPEAHVRSKDVVFSQQPNLSSRLYLPKNLEPSQKLPLLLHYHGGGFVIETPYSPNYHKFCNILAAEANIIIVSVDYRRAPEHPLPAAYDDSWAALKWVASHSTGDGPEEWINNHADLSKVFLAGDSAGANIAHNVGMRSGLEKLGGVEIVGMVLIHPYFWGKEAVGGESKEEGVRLMINKIWYFACPETSGCDDPLINPGADPKLESLGCKKVIVFVAEKDILRDRGWFYYESLKQCGWGGAVEIVEAKEENHVFHLSNPENENAKIMFQNIASFISQH